MNRPALLDTSFLIALAQQHALTLVSRDAHFAAVPGLAVLSWTG